MIVDKSSLHATMTTLCLEVRVDREREVREKEGVVRAGV